MHAPRWACAPLIIAFLTTLTGIVLSTQGSIGWGLFVIGIGILAIAILSRISQVQFLERAYHANGIVIGHTLKSLGEEDAWSPVVRYTLPDGQEVTFQGGVSSSRMRESLPVSTKVDVLYDPTRPESAIINKSSEKIGPYLAGLFAIAFLVAGILVIAGLIRLNP